MVLNIVTVACLFGLALNFKDSPLYLFRVNDFRRLKLLLTHILHVNFRSDPVELTR